MTEDEEKDRAFLAKMLADEETFRRQWEESSRLDPDLAGVPWWAATADRPFGCPPDKAKTLQRWKAFQDEAAQFEHDPPHQRR